MIAGTKEKQREVIKLTVKRSQRQSYKTKTKRQCSRNKGHDISKGDRCLVIKENMAKNNYCMEYAALILRKDSEELSQLSGELDSSDQKGQP